MPLLPAGRRAAERHYMSDMHRGGGISSRWQPCLSHEVAHSTLDRLCAIRIPAGRQQKLIRRLALRRRVLRQAHINVMPQPPQFT